MNKKITISLVLVVVLIALNIMTGMLVKNNPSLLLNLSGNKSSKISQEAKDYFKNLDKDISFIIFSSTRYENEPVYLEYNTTIKKLASLSKKINLKVIPINKDEDQKAAEKYIMYAEQSQQQLGFFTVVVENGENFQFASPKQIATGFDYSTFEGDVVNAIAKAIDPSAAEISVPLKESAPVEEVDPETGMPKAKTLIGTEKTHNTLVVLYSIIIPIVIFVLGAMVVRKRRAM